MQAKRDIPRTTVVAYETAPGEPRRGRGGRTPPQGGEIVYVERRGNGLAVASLVCGVVGLVLGLIPILFFIAWALGITGFILGLVARRRGKDPNIGRRTMATWGIVLGIAAFGMGCVGYAVLTDALNSVSDSLEQGSS